MGLRVDGPGRERCDFCDTSEIVGVTTNSRRQTKDYREIDVQR